MIPNGKKRLEIQERIYRLLPAAQCRPGRLSTVGALLNAVIYSIGIFKIMPYHKPPPSIGALLTCSAVRGPRPSTSRSALVSTRIRMMDQRKSGTNEHNNKTPRVSLKRYPAFNLAAAPTPESAQGIAQHYAGIPVGIEPPAEPG